MVNTLALKWSIALLIGGVILYMILPIPIIIMKILPCIAITIIGATTQ